MRKNNLVKNLLAAMTLLIASSTMISCQGLVDAVIGSEDNPVTPVVTPIVENTGATAEEVTALLEEALSVKAVQEAIASGDPIKITVAGGSSTTASNSVIEIPMTTSTGNKVAIELTFTDAITTSTSNPLEFVANEGADAASGESENELVITMPDATGLVVNIELPNTTVTLASTGKTVYKTLTAKTAQETLIVDELDAKLHPLLTRNIVLLFMDPEKNKHGAQLIFAKKLLLMTCGVLVDSSSPLLKAKVIVQHFILMSVIALFMKKMVNLINLKILFSLEIC